MNKYPEYIMEAVRQNYFDLEADDTSKDEKIEEMDPETVFGSWVNWEGIFGYTGNILDAIESIYDCSFDDREFY